jgi:hypothetical protein
LSICFVNIKHATGDNTLGESRVLSGRCRCCANDSVCPSQELHVHRRNSCLVIMLTELPAKFRWSCGLRGRSLVPRLLGTGGSNADPSGRAVEGESLWPFACWGCGFEYRRGGGLCCVCSTVRTKGKSQDNQDTKADMKCREKKSHLRHGSLSLVFIVLCR